MKQWKIVIVWIPENDIKKETVGVDVLGDP